MDDLDLIGSESEGWLGQEPSFIQSKTNVVISGSGNRKIVAAS